jgi:hypothetical protein
MSRFGTKPIRIKRKTPRLFLRLVFCLALAAFGMGPAAVAQPGNDNFANRILLHGSNLTVTGTLASATAEPGEPFLDGISSGQTAWWSWTAPTNGIVTFSANSPDFNPLVSVYVGNNLASLALVASNNYLICYDDGACGCHWRMRDQITFHVAAGQHYQFDLDSPIITDASWTGSWSGWEWGFTGVTIIIVDPTYPEGDSVPATNFVPVTPIVADQTSHVTPHRMDWSVTMTTNIIPGGDVSLQLQFTPAPRNDEFAHRLKLWGARTHVNASNYGATSEPGEPDKMGNPGGSSIWYTWTALASGRVSLSTNNVPPYLPPSYYDVVYGVIDYSGPQAPTCGNAVDQNPPPPFFPVLAAFTGTNVASLTPANCLPMGLDAYPYAIEFDVLAGHAYQIAVDGNMGTTGDMILSLALTTPAVNATFAHRIGLRGIYVVVTGYNAGAAPQPGAPNLGNGSTGKIAWWSWKSPVSGAVSIDLSASDFAFPAAVFTGNVLSNLSLVAAGAGGLSFDAVAGRTYQIAVGDASGLTGEIKMTLQAPVTAVPLARILRRTPSNSALLFFGASPGQVLLLQRSRDGVQWRDVQTATARQSGVVFYVTPAPSPTGLQYRAIIVD